eukprot:TRINITY_DN51863_c0_g1_i1.p1 TRINITY_DN51863_c0_g1~~TRINITY_DN51863_c0_g1_i1.p1  ORF type:complete len:873 (+),score=283.60 TRINITY_DN51863_c0_g1_i1:90-2621(+)
MLQNAKATAHQSVFNSVEEVPGGVLCEGDLTPLTLLGARIDIAVEHFVARVKVTQEYCNSSSKPRRCIYSCPLGSDWTVTQWTVATPAGSAEAVAGERESPFALFREGCFVAPVPGEVHPGDTVTVSITFLTAVRSVGGSEYNFEVWVDRHVIPEGRVPDTDWKGKFKISVQPKLPRTIAVNARVLAPAKLDNIALPSSWQPSPQVSRVDYHGELAFSRAMPHDEKLAPFPEDLQLLVDVRKDGQQLMKFEIVAPSDDKALPAEDTYVLSVTVHPTEQTLATVASGTNFPDMSAPNSEVVLVVDCSGSMHGVMEGVRTAALMAVSALPASCMINVVAFGRNAPGGVIALSDESLEFSDEALDNAREFISRLKGDLGQTDLYPALRFAYTRKVRRGYCRQIFLITDAVSPERDVLGSQRDCVQLARDNRGSTRLWCLGLRPYCDDSLLRPLAELSGGQLRWADSGAALQRALLQTLAEALTPCLTNAELTYSLESDQQTGDPEGTLEHIRPCYSSMPLLFLGRRYTVCAIAGSQLAPDTAVTLSALVGDQDVSLTDHVQQLGAGNKKLRRVQGSAQELLTHTAAARDRIKCLVEPEWEWKQWLAAGGGERCLFGGPSLPTAAQVQELVRLSRTFNLTTPYTALRLAGPAGAPGAEVALEYRYELPGDPRRAKLQARRLPAPRTRALRLAPDGRAIEPDTMDEVEAPPPQSTADFAKGIVREIVGYITDPAYPELMQLLELQCADGRWEATERLARTLGTDLRTLQKGQPEAPEDAGADGASPDFAAAWGTALAVTLLSRRFESQQADWRMMQRRAELYLGRQGCSKWLKAAEDFLSQLHAAAAP